MIRRNTASQTIYLPCLKLTADGAAVTSSATLTVSKDGTESASAGTLTHSSGGVWKYTPTQGETDAAIVALILTATGADPVVLNCVTTGADTSAVALGALMPTVASRTLNVSTTGEGDAVLNTTARVKLDASQPDYAPATVTGLSALTTKIRKYFQLSLRKDAAIATDNATELTEINANGGSGGGTYLSTTDSQEAIRDAIPNFVSSIIFLPPPVLTPVGMPETLEIGDSYDEDAALTIYIRDENDDPVSAAVGHDFTDGDFAPTFVIAPTPGSPRGRVKGTVTYVVPGGSDEPYLKVEIPSSQTKLAVAGEASVQLVLKWTGAEKTLLNTTVIWLPRI